MQRTALRAAADADRSADRIGGHLAGTDLPGYHVSYRDTAMRFNVEIEQEEDGRWIAEVVELPGALAYGQTSQEATAKVQALALRVVADRLEHGEAGPDLLSITFAAA
jgi:predicted RNase H-like HicB family nuclease